MIIRDAREEDARHIAAIHAASWRFAYRGALSDVFLTQDIDAELSAFWADRLRSAPRNQHIIVAENGEALIGFACVYTNFDEQLGTLLDNLHVSLTMLRQGIGTKLLVSIATWCRANNAPGRLFLWVLQTNLHAQRFYQALGAVNAGSGIWVPPGGGKVPRYRYAWQNISSLLHKAEGGPIRSISWRHDPCG